MRNRSCLIAVMAVVALSQLRLEAIYVRPDLEVVPVDRLIQNLERMVAREPDNATLRLNLARAHAMAFATNSQPVQVQQGAEQNGVFFGFSPQAVPFQAGGTEVEPSFDASSFVHASAWPFVN